MHRTAPASKPYGRSAVALLPRGLAVNPRSQLTLGDPGPTSQTCNAVHMATAFEGDTASVVTAAQTILDTGAKNRRIAVVYHADPDGLSAATFTIDYLARAGDWDILPYGVTTDAFDFEKLFEWLASVVADVIVTLDLNFSSRVGATTRLGKSAHLVLSYDDHVRNAGENRQPSAVHRLSSIDSLSGQSVPATYFAYRLWLTRFPDSLTARAIAASGLIADRAYTIVSAERWFRRDELTLIRRYVGLISASYAALSFEPADDKSLEWSIAAIRRDENILDAIRSPDRFLTEATRRRVAIDKIVATGSKRLADPASIVPGTDSLHLYRFEADYRVANLVASSARSALESASDTKAGTVACQKLSDGTTMAELRLTRAIHGTSLPAILGQVSGEIHLVNFGGHGPAAGCRYWTQDHDAFVTSLSRVWRVRELDGS